MFDVLKAKFCLEKFTYVLLTGKLIMKKYISKVLNSNKFNY